ncbi:MAG: hypothetical protein ACKO81_07210, partial [Planctomycetota bacterium]
CADSLCGAQTFPFWLISPRPSWRRKLENEADLSPVQVLQLRVRRVLDLTIQQLIASTTK